MKNQAQLITYVDRLPGGTFRDLQRLVEGPLAGAFGGLHVLPFFHRIDGADAGFDPIDHTQVDQRLGTWADVATLAARVEVMADLIVNHISRYSPQFQDYDRRGDDSPYAGMFLTYSRVFPQGAREADLRALQTIRPSLPFTTHQTAHGEEVTLWTTFTSDQIDIDVQHPEGERYLTTVLSQLQGAGIRAIRLDAVGFSIKKAGTSCFMIPETFAFIDAITAQAHALGVEVLVEVHGQYQQQIEVARRVDWVYDFALPPLMLHTLYTRDSSALRRWLDLRPPNIVTVLDTHDGIGVVDADGLLSAQEIGTLVETIHERSRGESRLASGSAAANVDTSQINCTFYDALGCRDGEYLVARAIQCFIPGIPQIYYVGLLAGRNDTDLLRRTGIGRDINRHYYEPAEVVEAMNRPVVGSLLSLLHVRNTHRAFGGTFTIEPSPANRLVLRRTNDDDWVQLDADLSRMCATISAGGRAEPAGARVWRSEPEA
jgi:sucrose phosphorylase